MVSLFRRLLVPSAIPLVTCVHFFSVLLLFLTDFEYLNFILQAISFLFFFIAVFSLYCNKFDRYQIGLVSMLVLYAIPEIGSIFGSSLSICTGAFFYPLILFLLFPQTINLPISILIAVFGLQEIFDIPPFINYASTLAIFIGAGLYLHKRYFDIPKNNTIRSILVYFLISALFSGTLYYQQIKFPFHPWSHIAIGSEFHRFAFFLLLSLGLSFEHFHVCFHLITASFLGLKKLTPLGSNALLCSPLYFTACLGLPMYKKTITDQTTIPSIHVQIQNREKYQLFFVAGFLFSLTWIIDSNNPHSPIETLISHQEYVSKIFSKAVLGNQNRDTPSSIVPDGHDITFQSNLLYFVPSIFFYFVSILEIISSQAGLYQFYQRMPPISKRKDESSLKPLTIFFPSCVVYFILWFYSNNLLYFLIVSSQILFLTFLWGLIFDIFEKVEKK